MKNFVYTNMKYVKTFETFDFSQTLPSTSKNFLNNYYHCDGCNALFKSFNTDESICKFCDSEEIEELSEDEYYSAVGERLDDDEKEDLRQDREREESTFINLYNLNKKNVN